MLKDEKSAIVSNVHVTNAQYENQKVNLKENAPKCSCASKERFHCIDVDATVLDALIAHLYPLELQLELLQDSCSFS